MSQQTTQAQTVPSRAPTWDELRDRAPYEADVRDDPSGGVVVHRCHPDSEPTDFFAFASRHETMKGYVDKNTYLFTGPVGSGREPAIKAGIGQWDSAVGSFHMRAGSHEDCAVCQGTADPAALLREVVETATEQVGGEDNVARHSISTGRDHGPTHKAFVYLDSHGRYSSGDTYSVDNSTQHWDAVIRSHPYVEMIRAEETGTGGNWSSPDDTLRIELTTHYPNTTPEVRL